MVYKVSIVIPGYDRGGAIINLTEKPEVGSRIRVSEVEVEITEVMELMPPRGDFYFLHATGKLVKHPPIQR